MESKFNTRSPNMFHSTLKNRSSNVKIDSLSDEEFEYMDQESQNTNEVEIQDVSSKSVIQDAYLRRRYPNANVRRRYPNANATIPNSETFIVSSNRNKPVNKYTDNQKSGSLIFPAERAGILAGGRWADIG